MSPLLNIRKTKMNIAEKSLLLTGLILFTSSAMAKPIYLECAYEDPEKMALITIDEDAQTLTHTEKYSPPGKPESTTSTRVSGVFQPSIVVYRLSRSFTEDFIRIDDYQIDRASLALKKNSYMEPTEKMRAMKSRLGIKPEPPTVREFYAQCKLVEVSGNKF
jgi:hypothetical protein